MAEGTVYKQERPSWCPHATCKFKRRAMDSLCGGELPGEAKETDEFGQLHVNDLRICLNETHQPPPNAKIIDFLVNASDLDWFRFVYDALDDRRTSWLSTRGQRAGATSAKDRIENVLEDANELVKKLKGTEHEAQVTGMAIQLEQAISSLTETERIPRPPSQ